jgi:hypothetical protein
MWQVQQQDDSNNEVEIWYPKENQLALTLITLDDQILGPVGLNQKFNLELEDGETLGRIIHQQSQIGNGDCQINILLDKRLYGDWRIQLQNVGSERAPFHAWIERDNRKLSRFAEEHVKRSHTIGSISCGKHTIAVGSYDAEKPGKPLSSFSAEGPTRDGKNKPEISAPGQNIMAANALTQGAIGKNGTSMAAPHVAGVVALMMQAAGHVLPIGDLRQALIATARKDPPPGNPQHHPRYGTGRVDGLAALLTQLGD